MAQDELHRLSRATPSPAQKSRASSQLYIRLIQPLVHESCVPTKLMSINNSRTEEEFQPGFSPIHSNKRGRKFRANWASTMDLHPLLLPVSSANFAQIRPTSRKFGRFCFFPFFLTYTPVYYTPVCSVPTEKERSRASAGPSPASIQRPTRRGQQRSCLPSDSLQ